MRAFFSEWRGGTLWYTHTHNVIQHSTLVHVKCTNHMQITDSKTGPRASGVMRTYTVYSYSYMYIYVLVSCSGSQRIIIAGIRTGTRTCTCVANHINPVATCICVHTTYRDCM